jgi:hypothetical protein
MILDHRKVPDHPRNERSRLDAVIHASCGRILPQEMIVSFFSAGFEIPSSQSHHCHGSPWNGHELHGVGRVGPTRSLVHDPPGRSVLNDNLSAALNVVHRSNRRKRFKGHHYSLVSGGT